MRTTRPVINEGILCVLHDVCPETGAPGSEAASGKNRQDVNPGHWLSLHTLDGGERCHDYQEQFIVVNELQGRVRYAESKDSNYQGTNNVQGGI